jgi:hypothetical protein
MLLRGSDESEQRILAIIGTAALVCAVVASLGMAFNPFKGRPRDRISVTIDTSYVGQGVNAGTAVVMHGVRVGEVTGLSSLPAGGVRLVTDLQKNPVADLTDTMSIDFEPINYFGVTGINIVANGGGHAIRDGSQITTMPRGNFTLQALLSRLSEVSSSALTPQLIKVIDRTTQYTDGLNPLLETILTITNTLADVQTVPTSQLLAHATGVSVALPSFIDAGTDGAESLISSDPPLGGLPENVWKKYTGFLDAAGGGLFGAVGKLEASHVDDLFPTIEAVKSLTDAVPVLLRPDDLAPTLVELRSRFEKMFAGSPEQRALKVRVVLDNIPGIAAPLGLAAGRQ